MRDAMTMPLIGFVLGLLIFLYAVLSHGRLLFGEAPEGFIKRDFFLCFTGFGLIAIALMLGLVGYFGYLSADVVRPIRIVLGLIGLSLLFFQYIETNSRA